MDYAAISISIMALAFTIYSFWWMNWRKGKLLVGAPRSYAATGSEQGKVVVQLPLVFFNNGPMPIVVDNIRLVFSDQPEVRSLEFVATVKKIASDEGRAFATQFPVRGRESLLLICEFQRHPGGMLFEAKSYPVRIQAKLGGTHKWISIVNFQLNVSDKALTTINKQFVAHDNTPLA